MRGWCGVGVVRRLRVPLPPGKALARSACMPRLTVQDHMGDSVRKRYFCFWLTTVISPRIGWRRFQRSLIPQTLDFVTFRHRLYSKQSILSVHRNESFEPKQRFYVFTRNKILAGKPLHPPPHPHHPPHSYPRKGRVSLYDGCPLVLVCAHLSIIISKQ